MLYPQENELRELRDLSGVWHFKIDWEDVGLDQAWFAAPLTGEIREIAVPSSYNDLYADRRMREHVGAVWYEREVCVPASWTGRHLLLRFDAAAHHSTVWWNGRRLGHHKGGFLPFVFDLAEHAPPGQTGRLTVAVDNRLDWSCLPCGELFTRPDGDAPSRRLRRQENHFDFFNYAGLHRPVRLLSLPSRSIEAIRLRTTPANGTAWTLDYSVDHPADTHVHVRVLDPDGKPGLAASGTSGALTLASPPLWEPGHGRLHALEVRLEDATGQLLDVYREPFGVRSVRVEGARFLINERPFYFRGFGKHEDADIRGRGLDLPLLVHDFALLEWIGANSVRTSHYPYSEEFMRMADRQGMVVIDEVPAVGMHDNWGTNPVFVPGRIGPATLAHHCDVTRDLIARDGNHPCVVMWSLGNEPATEEVQAEEYFRTVIELARQLDPTRPMTVVEAHSANCSRIGQLVDVVCVNRYIGWYVHTGEMDLVSSELEKDLRAWHDRDGRPVLVAEFGVDTVHGLHSLQGDFFTEEFQCEFLSRYHAVFDRLPFVIGEHVWNFADFSTKQGIKRVAGNRKGVFTRSRNPKAAAHLLRQRWHQPSPKAS